MSDPRNQLKEEVEKQLDRMKRAERQRTMLLASMVYLGTVGLSFVLPIVVGAYAGRWLDGLVEGYSVRWTVSLIVFGVVVGAVNVYLMMTRE